MIGVGKLSFGGGAWFWHTQNQMMIKVKVEVPQTEVFLASSFH